jgi:NAD(P)H dehydrogenase (quinone)
MKIAITAASGQLGAAIVNATAKLVGAGNVVAVARTPSKAQGLGVEVRPGSYDDRSALQQAFAGIDTVLLVSGMDAPDKRIEQHRNVIEAAKAAGVRKLVYTSVQGPEEGSAFSPIVQSNRQTEQDVKASGLDWVIDRLECLCPADDREMARQDPQRGTEHGRELPDHVHASCGSGSIGEL